MLVPDLSVWIGAVLCIAVRAHDADGCGPETMLPTVRSINEGLNYI